ncbi:MAG: hypothetical protein M0Z50_11610 [Planctomycetia bacterium]|nr:hypothetical protein [Planctomycetia bacterium]
MAEEAAKKSFLLSRAPGGILSDARQSELGSLSSRTPGGILEQIADALSARFLSRAPGGILQNSIRIQHRYSGHNAERLAGGEALPRFHGYA